MGTMLLLWTQAMKIEEMSPAVTGEKTPQIRIKMEKSRPNLCFLKRFDEPLKWTQKREMNKLTLKGKNKSAHKFREWKLNFRNATTKYAMWYRGI